MSEPIPISEFVARLRRKAEESKAALQADPSIEESIRARIAEHEASIAEDGRRYREARLEAAGIPRRLWRQLDALRDTDALAAVREWAASEEMLLVLEGNVGTGKTVAASWWLSTGGSGLFRKAYDLATLSSFDAERREALCTTPALVIDDLGTEPLDEKGWGLSGLLTLIDCRYDAALPTLLTTNLSIETMRARYGVDGGRLFDRLRESGAWVQIGGESLRRGGER